MIRIKRIIALALAMLTLISALSLVACKDNGNDFGTTLSFAKANSIEEMKKLDGQTVSIVGYMSTLSPISGKFMQCNVNDFDFFISQSECGFGQSKTPDIYSRCHVQKIHKKPV